MSMKISHAADSRFISTYGQNKQQTTKTMCVSVRIRVPFVCKRLDTKISFEAKTDKMCVRTEHRRAYINFTQIETPQCYHSQLTASKLIGFYASIPCKKNSSISIFLGC